MSKMTREEALRYVKSAAGHLIATDRKVGGMALLKAWDALRSSGWVRTAERLPTEEDEGKYGVVVAFNRSFEIEPEPNMGLAACIATWCVRASPEHWTYWMPLPALPEA